MTKSKYYTQDNHRSPGIDTGSDSHVKPYFADECEINNILAKYQKTGLVEHVTNNPGVYGDYSNVPNYRDALNIVIDAQDNFDSLPSSIRKRFDNDPSLFLDFVYNPENRDEMVKMGLIETPTTVFSSEKDNSDVG